MKPDEVLKELRRELSMRRKLYPQWEASGKIKTDTANHRVDAIAEAIRLIEEAYPQQGEVPGQMSLELFSLGK